MTQLRVLHHDPRLTLHGGEVVLTATRRVIAQFRSRAAAVDYITEWYENMACSS